jgi:hypothetical protein
VRTFAVQESLDELNRREWLEGEAAQAAETGSGSIQEG